jgi:hypothetical protein
MIMGCMAIISQPGADQVNHRNFWSLGDLARHPLHDIVQNQAKQMLDDHTQARPTAHFLKLSKCWMITLRRDQQHISKVPQPRPATV